MRFILFPLYYTNLELRFTFVDDVVPIHEVQSFGSSQRRMISTIPMQLTFPAVVARAFPLAALGFFPFAFAIPGENFIGGSRP